MKTASTFNMLSFLVGVFLLAGLCSAAPQKANRIQRIKIARGQTSAVVRGELKPYTNHLYKLTARKGQQMTVRLQTPKDDVVFWIQSRAFIPKRQTYLLNGIDKGGTTDWTGDLDFTGEYEIQVSNPLIIDHEVKRSISYRLEVKIR